MFFPDNVRTYGRANFDYDALIASEHGNKHVLSFLDCDLARLKRFKEGLEFYSDRLGEVVCYPWMTEFVRKYMEGTNITINEIPFEEVEEYLFDN